MPDNLPPEDEIARLRVEKVKPCEVEFVRDMLLDGPDTHAWRNFDPDFRQTDIARLLRRGWFERRVEGGYREYRWTEAGIRAFVRRAPEARTHTVDQGGCVG